METNIDNIKDLAVTCNVLAIMKKGNVLYSGKISAVLGKAKGKGWLCKVKNEDEFSVLQQKFIVSAK